MERVICDVLEIAGLENPDYRTAVVGRVGGTESILVPSGILEEENGHFLLPVVRLKTDGDKALIQLPYESDSGANRIWVPVLKLKQEVLA